MGSKIWRIALLLLGASLCLEAFPLAIDLDGTPKEADEAVTEDVDQFGDPFDFQSDESFDDPAETACVQATDSRSHRKVMATANISGDGEEKPIKELTCSEGLSTGTHGHLTFISTINIFLSITAFLGNALILVALSRESSLHPPSKLLLRNLAATDLCVGLISEPVSVALLMSIKNEQWNICHYLNAARFETGAILGLVSLLTLTAVSVDRLLALLLRLRYRQVVTLKRTYVIVITFWVVSTVFSTLHFWNVLITLWYAIICISFCLVTAIFSYSKIFLNLRNHQNQVQHQTQQPHQANPLNIARYRKAVSCAVWLQLTLVACYFPESVVVALIANIRLSSPIFVAYQYTATLAFLNSSLNPILYCWKIDEVRQAVKDTIRQVLCCFVDRYIIP